MKPITDKLIGVEEEIVKIILECHEKNFQGDKDPFEVVGYNKAGQGTMVIDKAIEDAVYTFLRDLDMKGLFLAEEHGTMRSFGTEEVVEGHDLVVILDPIDGSENMKRSIPFYSSAIGLGLKSTKMPFMTFADLLVGSVIDFGMETVIQGVTGRGISIKGKTSRFYDLNSSFQSTNVAVCGYLRVRHYQVVMNALKKSLKSFSLRNMGSVALELTYAALSKFDLVIDFRNRLNAYDIAASCIILKEAGSFIMIYPERGYRDVPLGLNRKFSLMVSRDLSLIEKVEDALGGIDGIRRLLR